MCQEDLAHNIWGLSGGSFHREAGEIGDRGEKGHFQPLREASQAILRVIRAHRFPPPLILHLFLRLNIRIPGVVGVSIKVIIVPGELRELIQDVAGRP